MQIHGAAHFISQGSENFLIILRINGYQHKTGYFLKWGYSVQGSITSLQGPYIKEQILKYILSNSSRIYIVLKHTWNILQGTSYIRSQNKFEQI